MTYRAVDVLKQVDLILAEDTRTSSVLLDHYGIRTPRTPFHQHNEHKKVASLTEQLALGKQMALLTDAGTPGISDPAYLLVRACIDQQIPVTCLPGATAFVPALVVSGMPLHAFSFAGFPPLKKGRQTFFREHATGAHTLVLYESPMRLLRTLEDIAQHFGPDRDVCVCRELSKKFEAFHRGTAAELISYFQATPPRGEIVVVVRGATSSEKNPLT